MLFIKVAGLLFIIFTLTAALSNAQESTFYALNGNHLVPGKIDLRQATSVKIKLSSGGSKIVHSIKLDNQLSTNLAAYSSRGKIKLAFGTYNNELIIIRQ